MKARMFSTLEQALDAWVDEHSMDYDWSAGFFGKETVTLMATAAAAVLDACAESQATAVVEGNLSEG